MGLAETASSSIRPQLRLVPENQAYKVTIDEYDDYGNYQHKRGNDPGRIDAFVIQGRTQIPRQVDHGTPNSVAEEIRYREYVFVDKVNSIECDDRVPLPDTIPMAFPMSWDDFSRTTQLCAIAGDGGNM